MSSNHVPDYSVGQQFGEKERLKISSNTQIVIENNSDDITISKCDQNSATPEISANSNLNVLPLKAQVLPLVYIGNSSKIPFGSVNTGTKPNNSFIFSSIQSNPSYVSNATTSSETLMSSKPNVIFASGRGRPLVLPKPPITIMPAGSKVAGTYVTMLKQVPKMSESHQVDTHTSQKMPDNNNGFISGIKSNPNQKFVITPMPKMQTNRPPATCTTNSVQPKITVLPMPVPQDIGPTTAKKVFNFQISDGKLQYTNFSGPLRIMSDNKSTEKAKEENLVCPEKIEDSPEKTDISNKTYELSIAEETLSNQSDSRLVVSSLDSNSSENQSFSKQPIKFSHGVSILKKNFGCSTTPDKKFEPFTITNNLKSTFETGFTVIKPSNGMEEKIVVTIPSVTAPKPDRERRRKSQFSLRKDFDDMEISFPDSSEPIELTKSVEIHKEKVKEELVVPKEEIKIEDTENSEESVPVVPDTKNLFNLNDDASKLLNWEDGVGTLPGSNLKFILNEFGIIEYLSEEDHRQILEKKIKKSREKADMEREVRCLECGCYGMRSDFINSDFCSNDCQEAGLSPLKKNVDLSINKKPKKKFPKTRSENDIKDINTEATDEENSNDTSQDKFSYPWACKKKGFSWSKYLAHVNAKAAPVKLFKDPFPYTRNGFKAGMKLEGVDIQHPSYFCVLTVMETVGYRIRLHFDGYPDNYDFWTNADSMNIFPIGWCEKYGHVLHPPPGYTVENFNWVQYLKVTKSTAAPKHLFANRAGQAICPNGFRIGMKLEAVDKKNTALVCVATVRDMMDNRILVHFDGWDDIYDYWADPTSPYIHPVGWCDQYGHNLTAPSDYPTPETFTWEKYLKETKSVAAPVRAFKQRPSCGFKRGMRLECVDRRVPQLIRVATVDDVKEHQIRIHFDGWPDRYSYWVDDDSPDIHPIGWCQKTGHPMESPLTPDDVYDFLECPTVGCRGQGHTRGLKYSTHSSVKFCPYAEENIDVEKVLPDRLLSPDRSPEAKVPVSREPKDYKTKPRLGRPPKWLKELESTKIDASYVPLEKKAKKKQIKIKKEEEETVGQKLVEIEIEKRAQLLIEQSKIVPAEKESWKKHSLFLEDFISLADNPVAWSSDEVVDFVASIPGCYAKADVLKSHQIDGESFLHLSQSDILRILNFKVGPAVKLYNTIVILREHFCEKT